MTKCSRKACQKELSALHLAIWNDPSTNEPCLYCVRCGNKILDYNPTLLYEWRGRESDALGNAILEAGGGA